MVVGRAMPVSGIYPNAHERKLSETSCRMSPTHEQFLGHRSLVSDRSRLGREFALTQETWRLTDDPKATRPKTQMLTTRITAAEAADAARAAAAGYEEHGFHKPSGAWWGSDGAEFHRFVVHTRGSFWPGKLLIASSLLSLAFAVAHRGRASRHSS